MIHSYDIDKPESGFGLKVLKCTTMRIIQYCGMLYEQI